eukprot:TRINITY_DN6186_c0_g1_i2.p1 TRINITY_DN6186_c0_g1~~TRINITY_DN6186_c0_g1_i2.p1  ORF type:complete len:567 (-),score=63.84 TRINITY_DN6186_c0_g1_i2:407-2044(-)
MSDIGGPFDLFGDVKFRGLRPTEDRGNIRTGDFVEIQSEEQLLDVMNAQYALKGGLRVISSAWSWNKIINATETSRNIFFGGAMSTKCDIDQEHLVARVAGSLMICDFVNYVRSEDLQIEWPPKGHCFHPELSQCFAGFIATNVHHSYTPTAYDWVESVRVAVFRNGKAAIVAAIVAASRCENTELFESVFGGAGFTGIVVEVCLKLREATFYHVNSVQAHYEDLTEAMHKVMMPGTQLIIVPHKRAYFQKVVTTAQGPGSDVPHVGKFDRALNSNCCTLASQTLRRACRIASCAVWWDYVNRKAVEISTEKIVRNVAYHATGCSDIEAFSWPMPRLTEVTKEAVADTEENVGLVFEVGFFVPVSEFSDFVDVFVSIDMPPAMVTLRYVPRPETATTPETGGVIAPNAREDVICVELSGAGDIRTLLRCCGRSELQIWTEDRLWPALYGNGFRYQTHLGKLFVLHPLFTESLTISQRKRLQALRQEYDPEGVFDGGEVKLEATPENIFGLFVLGDKDVEQAVAALAGPSQWLCSQFAAPLCRTRS